MLNSDISRTGKRWLVAAGLSAAAVPAAVGAFPSIASAVPAAGGSGPAPAALVWRYTGAPVVAKPGPGAVCLIAKGGDGAGVTGNGDAGGGGAAVVSGCLVLSATDTLTIAPGGRGSMEGADGAQNSQGGWGYLSSGGGSGHAASGDLPAGENGWASGGGGGATIVQLGGTNLIVAGGGGGQGGGQAGIAYGGTGGSGGPVAQHGAIPAQDTGNNDRGGLGGAMPGPTGQNGLAGYTAHASYSWGGAGGGGVKGGGSGTGSSPNPVSYLDGSGSGGGAGSSTFDAQLMHGAIETGTPGQNQDGEVQAWTASSLIYQATPSASSVAAGGSVTMTLDATAGNSPGFPLADGGVTWSSTVTPGQGDLGDRPDEISGSSITMYQAGSHTVTASVDGTPVATTTVEVTAGPLGLNRVAPRTTDITAGSSVGFVVTSYDSYGNPIGQLAQHLKYSSNVSSDVVTGDHVQFFAAGPHTVTASYSITQGTWTSYFKTSTTVQIAPGPAVSIAFWHPDNGSGAGSLIGFYLDGTDAYGNQFGIVGSDYTLTSSNITDEIGGNSIEFVFVGTRTITARLNGTSLTASTQFTVTPGPLVRIELQPSTESVTVGRSLTFSATGVDAYDNVIGPIDPSELTYSTVPATGTTVGGDEVTFTAPGTYYVQAFPKADDAPPAEAKITVNAAGSGGSTPAGALDRHHD